jgi:hypothetical protein
MSPACAQYHAVPPHLHCVPLVQGKTSRWGIAWSFTVPASTATVPLRGTQVAAAATIPQGLQHSFATARAAHAAAAAREPSFTVKVGGALLLLLTPLRVPLLLLP